MIYSCGKSPFLLLSPAPVSLSLSLSALLSGVFPVFPILLACLRLLLFPCLALHVREADVHAVSMWCMQVLILVLSLSSHPSLPPLLLQLLLLLLLLLTRS